MANLAAAPAAPAVPSRPLPVFTPEDVALLDELFALTRVHDAVADAIGPERAAHLLALREKVARCA